jgi:hydrogenase maturation protease
MQVMTDLANDILVIGYGNPGRQDDGLGPALAEALEQLRLPDVTVDSDYQLTVEHAEMASRHRVVVFADATTEQQQAFTWSQVEPGAAGIRFTSHHLAPADVLALARDLFGANPAGYVLAIRGRCFGEFDAGLSPDARVALEDAVEFLIARIRETNKAMTCKQ